MDCTGTGGAITGDACSWPNVAGTTGYTRGCRCGRCTAANQAKVAGWRGRMVREGVPMYRGSRIRRKEDSAA